MKIATLAIVLNENDDLPLDRMYDSDRHWLPQAARGEKFNARVYYRNRACDFDRVEFLPFSP